MMYSLTILSNKNPHPPLPTKKNPKRRNQNLDLSIVDHAIYQELHKKEKEKIKENRTLLSRTIITSEQSTDSTPSTTLPKSLETQVTWAKLLAEISL